MPDQREEETRRSRLPTGFRDIMALIVWRGFRDLQGSDGSVTMKRWLMVAIAAPAILVIVTALTLYVMIVIRESQRELTYNGSFLVSLLIPLRLAEDMQASLQDHYLRCLPRHGARATRWIMRVQVIMLIGGHWFNSALTIYERVVKAVRLIG